MYLKVAAALLCAALSACTTARLTTAFDPAAAAYVNETGTGTIRGQAFLRRNDGLVVYAAGSEVVLVPATPYAQERMSTIYRGSRFVSVLGSTKFENDNPRYYEYTRKTVADGEGRFEFGKVAPGRYFLTTSVFWRPNPNALFPEGGWVMHEVTVTEGNEPVSIIMSGT